MAARMRVIGWKVQPVIMRDDGETLEDVEVKGVLVPVKQWAGFKNGGDEQALAGIRRQIEGDDPVEDPVA